MVTLEGNVVAGQLSKLQVYTSIYSRHCVGKFVRQLPGHPPPPGRDLQAEGGQARAAAAERGRPEGGQEVRLTGRDFPLFLFCSFSAPVRPSCCLQLYRYYWIRHSGRRTQGNPRMFGPPQGNPGIFGSLQGNPVCLNPNRVILGCSNPYRV